jgi:hypothetical protein
MYDEMTVHVRDSRKRCLKELQAGFNTQVFALTVFVDRQAVDIFDDEVGVNVIENAGVDEPCNVGMIQACE